MVNKHIKKIRYFVILSLLLLISSIFLTIIPQTVNAEVNVADISSVVFYSTGHNEHSVRLSNGTLVTFYEYKNGSGHDLKCAFSSDNGSTWYNNITLQLAGGVYIFYNYSFAVDNDDVIHGLYALASGTSTQKIWYIKTNTSLSDWTEPEQFDVGQGNSVDRVRTCDIVIDDSDNVHAAWHKKIAASSKIYYRKYTHAISAWGAIQEVEDTLDGIPTCIDIQITKTDLPYIFHNGDGANISLNYYNGTGWSEKIFIGASSLAYTDFAVAYYATTSKMIIVYSDSVLDSINYIIYTVGGGSSSSTVVYQDAHGYPQSDVDVSITSAGIANIVWAGATIETANKKILYRNLNIKSNTFIDETAYLTIGNDVHRVPNLLYQQYPSSCVTASNYIMFYFNDTTDEYLYYDKINPIWTDELYEWDDAVPPGFLGINCFDEINGTNLTNFNVLIVNQTGDSYYNYNLNNTFLIINYAIPQGDILVTISRTNYYPRIYALTVENGFFYIDGIPYINATINAYLPNINLTYLYYIQVIDRYLYPIEDVQVTIKGFCGNTSYETISKTLTDGYGYTNVYLTAGRDYQFTMNKTGYATKTETWIPSILDYYKIFILDVSTNISGGYQISQVISVTAKMNETGTLFINVTDILNLTRNCQIYVYEQNHTSGTTTLIQTFNHTSNSTIRDTISSLNTSNTFKIIIHLNHSLFGYHIYEILIPGKYSTLTTPAEFNAVITGILKYCPFGWNNFFLLIGCAIVFFSSDREDIGWRLMLIGAIFFIIGLLIGFNNLFVTWANGIIPPLIIFAGFMIMWDDHRKGIKG